MTHRNLARFRVFLQVSFLLPLLSFSCRSEPPPDTASLRILSWNIQTLFDAVDAGTEYQEYINEAGWDELAYSHRLKLISKAFDAIMEDRPPDIIFLQEVENEAVLNDLRETCLKSRGYRWQVFSGGESLALGTGIFSRYPLSSCISHTTHREGESILRPVFECEVEAPGGSIRLFSCHWKSKLGGADETESLRMRAASIINARLSELMLHDPDSLFLIAGDLNTNADEFLRRGGGVATALLPCTPQSLSLEGAHEALLVGAEAGVCPSFERIVFMSPWFTSPYEGSYFYNGLWESIDHILLSPGFFDGLGWEYRAFSVFDGEPFTRGNGTPFRYSPANGLGYSDHLPLVMDLYFAGLPDRD